MGLTNAVSEQNSFVCLSIGLSLVGLYKYFNTHRKTVFGHSHILLEEYKLIEATRTYSSNFSMHMFLIK